jgi:hypothetical protein
MNLTFFKRGACLMVLGGLVASCSSSVQPSGSVTVTTPAQLAPANGATIPNLSQPITLTVTNAVVTDASGGVVYNFEVSNDSTFATKVQTKSAPAGGNGQTSVVLDTLPSGQSYFWHARASVANTAGPFSAAVKFTVGAAVSLGAPTPITPLTGATPSGWPIFTVGNSLKTGATGAVAYKFEVNTNSTFTGTTVLTQTVNETGAQTSFNPSINTAITSGTLFWRATALDNTNSISSSPSTAQSFVLSPLTQQARLALLQGKVLWPGIQPPGTNGHAALGDNWDLQTLVSFDGVTFISPTLEELQEFDLIDRGMDPGDAIGWMNTHGYTNTGLWVPAVQVVGFPFEYMALIQGAWELVVRIGG